MRIVINNVSHTVPEHYHKLSLEQGLVIQRYKKECSPEFSLDKQPDANTTTEKPTTTRDEAARTLLSVLCGVEREMANNVDVEDLHRFSSMLVNQLEASASIPQQQEKTLFVWQGETLHYPTHTSTYKGTKMPLYGISAIQFCEASDLYREDPWGYAPLIVAALCLPEGETYHEERIKERAQGMKNLPLGVVSFLFEELAQGHNLLRDCFPFCYRQPTVQSSEQNNPLSRNPSPQSWHDMLLWVAHHTPSEIAVTQRMELYPFMQLLNSRIKMQCI